MPGRLLSAYDPLHDGSAGSSRLKGPHGASRPRLVPRPGIIRRPGADAVHLTVYGVPCVTFGPGGRMHPDARNASSMHAFGEHVLVDDCVAAAKIYLVTALDLCSRRAS